MVVSRHNNSASHTEYGLWPGVAGALFGTLMVAIALKVGFQPGSGVSDTAIKVITLPLVSLVGLKLAIWGFKVARAEARLATHRTPPSRREGQPATHEIDLKLLLLSTYAGKKRERSAGPGKSASIPVRHPGNGWYH